MTEVIPETPMKIPEEEIKVEDVSEHLIKILDISEQNVNIMKEWMAFQGFEDISKFLDLSTETQMEGWTNMNHTSTQKGNKPFSLNMWHQTFPYSLTGTGNSPATTKCLHKWLPGST